MLCSHHFKPDQLPPCSAVISQHHTSPAVHAVPASQFKLGLHKPCFACCAVTTSKSDQLQPCCACCAVIITQNVTQVLLACCAAITSKTRPAQARCACCAGAGGNGAIIHYRAQQGSCKKVDKDTLLLLDSGGQFDCGTTDVTRTMHFGTPSDHQKMCFTRVLQVRLVMPGGTC